MYKNISLLWKKPRENLGDLWSKRISQWRKESVIERIEKPTRIDRAKSLGYKAKQGFIVVRARVKKGKRKTPKKSGGRRPKRAGRFFSLTKSKQVVAEERVARKFPNLEVLNSYWIGEDGTHKWYECILVDPCHPSVKKSDVKWISEKQHRGRAFRGLTSASKKSRGLRKKGKGTEKVRPSLGKHGRKAA